MESHPYTKTPGVGVSPVSADPLPVVTVQPLSSRSSCTYVNARGGRCRLFPPDANSSLCRHHQRLHLQQQRREDEAAANELLGNIEDFSTAASVNAFLGNLVKQLARKRIARRDAIALAYISQLLLNSFTPLDRQLAAKKKEADHQAFLKSFPNRRRGETSVRPGNGPASAVPSDGRGSVYSVRSKPADEPA